MAPSTSVAADDARIISRSFATPRIGATPAGPVATTTHYGPYGELHHAHVAIQEWCKKNGHTLAGPSWEIYGHWKDEWNRDPTKIVTDVYYLLVADGY